jgi:hypothetical protein
MPLKKARAKNYANFEYFRFCAFFRGGFFAFNYLCRWFRFAQLAKGKKFRP